MSVSILALPIALMACQRVIPGPFERRVISTEIVINARPESIWPFVREIEHVPESGFWLFNAGVAHPYRIEMVGSSGRMCKLTTGDMPERVLVEQKPSKFAFEVLHTPPSMKETNPFGEVHAAHLNGNYECEWGQFDLIRQLNGQTLVRGTSCYHYRMGPAWYWNLWTDKIVHEVHKSVLNEIKRQAEKSSLN